MRFRHLAVAAAAAALVTTIIPAYAAPTTPTSGPATVAQPGDEPRLTGRERAEQVLAKIEAALAGKGPGHRGAETPVGVEEARDLTLLLRDLRAALPRLSAPQRERAEQLLARPTDGGADPQGFGYTALGLGSARNTCGDSVCVHWVEASGDRPNLTDSDGDTVPDYVETALAAAESVRDRFVAAGYKAPLDDSDSDTADLGNPDGLLDVYLANIGVDGFYGFCTTDDQDVAPTDDANRGLAVSAYCVVDNDFSTNEFPGTPLNNLRVTLAHELFHAVQFAYDWYEDRWLMEGTAAWVEDELYDGVNDNLSYLRRQSPFTNPHTPLDYTWLIDDGSYYQPYGSWIFWRYLSERFRHEQGGIPTVVRDIWRRADGAGPYSLTATRYVLAQRNRDLAAVFRDFAIANRLPARTYEEGRRYPTAKLTRSFSLNNKRKSVAPQTTRLLHLANRHYSFSPAKNLKGKWRLRVSVNGPARVRAPMATLTAYHRNGAVTKHPVRLNSNGDGTRAVAFSRKGVKRVELTVTNASTRYQCWTFDTFNACSGRSRDDGQNGLPFTFRAALRR